MNAYYYYNLIVPFINKKDRAICTKKDRHLIAHKNKQKMRLNAFIYMHQGSPCWRYCICKYFTEHEIVTLYNNINI